MKQIDLREGARRQHRTLALFAVIQCWMRDLDGLVFERSQLERLLGLERFKQTRVNWLKEDMREFFPNQRSLWRTYPQRSFSSLYVSRRLLAPFPVDASGVDKRIEFLGGKGVRIDRFRMWSRQKVKDLQSSFETLIPFFADSANYDERLLSAYLSLLAQGQIAAGSIPPLTKDKKETKTPVSPITQTLTEETLK